MKEIFIQDNTIRDGFQQVGMCVNDFDLHIMKKTVFLKQ